MYSTKRSVSSDNLLSMPDPTYYEKNAKEIKARARAYYWANREKIRKAQNDRRTPEIEREYNLRHKFGITQADYDRMLKEQDGKCAVCRSPHSGRKDRKNFAVDHNHETKAIRGLLCVQCNTAAGNLRDDPGLCLKLAEYLRKTGAP